MPKTIKFPSIEQFRHAVKAVEMHAQYAGRDENDYPIYDKNKSLPQLFAVGTVKLHGTNASVYRDPETGNLVVQSRTKIITPEDDNAGFAKFVQAREHVFLNMLSDMGEMYPESLPVIYGEWCGRGIQKGTAINDCDPMFVIFAVRFIATPETADGEPCNYWAQLQEFADLHDHEDNIYNVTEFKTYTARLDFNNLEECRKQLEAITLDVEKQCPIAEQFGKKGIGEGVVWRFTDIDHNSSDFWFKIKGDKHKVASTKQKVEIAPEKAASINEFIGMVVTESRLEQGMSHLSEHGHEHSRKSTGQFLKWVVNDVLKEETDRLQASGLSKGDVTKAASTKAREWFFAKVG